MENPTNSRLDLLRSRVGQDMSGSLSPFGRWLNGTVRVVEYGHITADFRVRQDMTNPANVLHGSSIGHAGRINRDNGVFIGA